MIEKRFKFDMVLPHGIMEIHKIFKKKNRCLFLVGGAIRDALLNITPKGVVIMSAPSIHKKVQRLLEETATANNIPYQLTASGRGSGTNADSYAYPHGIPTGLLKMGMRYMHTTVETVHKKDVQSAIDLLIKILQNPELITSYKY